MARGSKDLLKVLANGTNREILSLLRAEPTYPRRLAELVGITEGEAQKRLRLLEDHGVVKGQWVHVGRNVKRYTLEAKALRIEVGPDGLALRLEGEGVKPEPVKLAVAQEAVPAAEHVVGRDGERAEVARLLEAKGAAAVLGIAGAGKSSLAARFARGQDRPVFWTTLRGTEGAPQLLSRLAVFLGSRGEQELVAAYVHLDPGHDLNAQLAILGEGLGRQRALVVVDDVHQAKDEALRGALAALLDRAGAFRVLLAGRSLPKGLPRARLGVLSLGGLDAADTRRLLEAHGLAAPAAAAAQVHAKTGGHPLALTLLAESARGKGVAPGELARLLPETRIEAYLWEEVFSELAAEERQFLARLSVLRGPADAALAEAVTGDARARERFYALERRHLCTPVAEAWAVHDVVREFAAKLGQAGPEVHARAARALEARGGLTDGLEALHHHLDAGEVAAALALVKAESAGGAYRFVDNGLATPFAALLRRLAPLAHGTDRTLVHLEAARCLLSTGSFHDAAQDLDAAEHLLGPRAPPRLRALHLYLSGWGLARAGDYAQGSGLLGRAADLAAQAGDERLLADAVTERADALENAAKLAEAERELHRALDLARKVGDPWREAVVEAGLSRVTLHRGKHAEALKHLQRGLALAEALRDLRVEATLRRTRAEVHMFRGDDAKAWAEAEGYLATARRLGDPWTLGCALMDSAWIAARQGRFEQAEPLARELQPLHQRVPMMFFWVQAEGLLVASAAARQDWAEFERRAREHHATGALPWYYGQKLFGDLEARLTTLLTAEARPAVDRLRKEKNLEPWLRSALEGWVQGARPKPAKGRAVRARPSTARGSRA